MIDSICDTAGKLATFRQFGLYGGISGPKGIGATMNQAINLTPPKIELVSIIKHWVALVLAVCHHTGVSHIHLLKHTGRSGKELADARRLLAWCLLEVCNGDTNMVIAWMEEVMALGRKSISNGLRGEPPPGIHEVLEIYTNLCRRLGPGDVGESIAAGLLGQKTSRARLFPKGFLERLGLGSKRAGPAASEEPDAGPAEPHIPGFGSPGSPATP